MPKVFVCKERKLGETRVAATPETVKKMVQAGLEVWVEESAGAASNLADEQYAAAGAKITKNASDLWRQADVVLKVTPLSFNEQLAKPEAEALKDGAIVIGFMAPHDHPDTVRALAEHRITALAMELIPRVTRAQSMDALSSQANVAGYKSAVLAAARLSKHFPLLMTAAGTISPARVVIMGGGVAGLQALATAKRLGAIVEVSDIRPAVREQVESLGGRFIDLPMEESGEGEGGYAKEMGEDFLRQQREIVKRHIAAADVVIATAQVPGKKAPLLVTADMVDAMRPGSVIIDLAAGQGGNCEFSKPDEEINHNGVLILGPTNLAATLGHDASTVYSRNVLALFQLLLKDEGKIEIDTNDEIIEGTLLTHAGEIIHKPSAEQLQGVSA
jgi:NAD(P) transhydrogenase subunit alpha